MADQSERCHQMDISISHCRHLWGGSQIEVPQLSAPPALTALFDSTDALEIEPKLLSESH
ncbi:Uncharacterised protein [Anaerotruncus sp. 2789STDY5834896]|uniref:Uncharacterized protein n=1 Tax=uncultured Anaerotruncus sp. TaxID=905011 RepID=A0A1C6INB7_9FIRM|nr:Uncharacterised protein [uncultured Anaerotruncus sp.]